MCTKHHVNMKGTKVPIPRRSNACDCTHVLPRIDHCLVTLSCLPCALFCSCLCKVRSRISDALSQALCNLSLAFPSWFHTIWFYCSYTFHRFLSQITLCFSLSNYCRDVVVPRYISRANRYRAPPLLYYFLRGESLAGTRLLLVS